MNSSKHIIFWSIAARNIRRFPARTISILVPLFIVMAFTSGMTFIKDAMLKDALYSINSLPDITVQQMAAGRIGFVPAEVSGEILQNESVRKVVPRAWGYVPVKSGRENTVYTLMGIDLNSLPYAGDISLTIEEGRFLNPGDKNCVIVGKIFAAQNLVKPGDEINFNDEFGNQYHFNVVGIFTSFAKSRTANLILTDIASARAFLGYKNDQSSDLLVYLKDPSSADLAARSISALRNNIRTLTKENLIAAAKQAYGTKSGVFQLVWLILLLSVLLLAWSQASSIGLEMKKEIGVLKAIGWRTLDIIEMKVMEVIIIGLLGVLGGIILGIAYLCLGAPFVNQYFLGWAGIYPKFPLPICIEWSSLFLLFVMGLLPLCAATIFPAWFMGVIEPDRAIRSE